VKRSQIPEVSLSDGVSVRIISGSFEGTRGPVRDIVTDPEYLDVTVAPGKKFIHPVPQGRTVFAYCIDGEAMFCKGKNTFDYTIEGVNYFDFKRDPYIRNGSLVMFGDGEQVTVVTEDKRVRFLLVSGKPLGEPVAWYGPIVMNTQEELQTAFEEYRNGTFIRERKNDHIINGMRKRNQ